MSGLPDAIEQAIGDVEDEWQAYGRRIGTLEESQSASGHLRAAIAAATFSEEELAAVKALARFSLATKRQGYWLIGARNYPAHVVDDFDAIPTDVLQQLAGEGG